ncbi:MAG TPA: SDR family oxidoreductase [Anaerolineales bacterium]|nr:SDR family oxidoreductase [Anaerolineales bacterium]
MNSTAMSSSPPVILITGASSGIGAASARLFAKQGYRVVLAARRLDRMQTMVEEIRKQGGQALAIQTDVSRWDSVKQMVQVTLDSWGQVDVLFNNAGFGRLDWLENLDVNQDVQEQITVNLTGLIWTTQAVLPAMISRRKGQIINMASMAALVAPPTYSVYAATKFAIRGFSESIRREVRLYGIRVSTIYPGAVATEFEEIAGAQRKTGIRSPEFLTLSSEQVAEAVYKLAFRPRNNVVIPWPMRLAAWGNALLPGLYDKAIERLFVRPERQD